MSRLICWECGKQLMYVKGKPVYLEYADTCGNVHKLHKICFKVGGYENKPVTAAVDMETARAQWSVIAKAVLGG